MGRKQLGASPIDSLDPVTVGYLEDEFPLVAFRARRSATRNVSTSFINMNANLVDYDTNGDYDNVTNFNFTAPYDGIYRFEAHVLTEASVTGRAIVNWYASGSGASDNTRAHDIDSTRMRRIAGVWEGYLPQGGTIYPGLWSSTSIDINSTETWWGGHLVRKWSKP